MTWKVLVYIVCNQESHFLGILWELDEMMPLKYLQKRIGQAWKLVGEIHLASKQT